MRKYIVGFLMILFSVFAVSNTSQASQPKVMVDNYEMDKEKVAAGDDFCLTITLINTSAKSIKNMKISILSETGEILPRENAGTAYVDKLDGGMTIDIPFWMMAAKGIEEKAYKISVKLEYEDTSGISYTVEDSIYIPVSLEQRLSVTGFWLDEDIKLGDEVELTGMINNLGDGTLYNVSVATKEGNLGKEECYVGNIETGKSGNFDIVAKAVKVTEAIDGEINHIIVTYEDKEGNKTEKEEKYSVIN